MPLPVKLRKKKAELFKSQEEAGFRAIEMDGNKFVFLPAAEKKEREVSASVSHTGVGGSYGDKKDVPKYDGFVIESGSTKPIPLEKWREQAGYALKTASAGAVMPEQLGNLSFSVSPNARYPWSPMLRPPSDYIKSRIRKGIELYQRGGWRDLDVSFVPALANTVTGGRRRL